MKQDKNEIRWDKLLKIRTTGRDDSKADQYRYPYEPTPYSVLERLANSGLIHKNNTLIMDAAKEELIILWHIRQNVILLG